MSYRVVILAEAEQELEEAYLWLRAQAPPAADEWLNGLLQARDSLSRFAKRCPLAPESEHFADEIRQLLCGKGRGQYRILLTIERDTVYIPHIRYAARGSIKPTSRDLEDS